jgi:hypothetical protein
MLMAKAIPFAFATGHGATALQPPYESALVLGKPFDFEQVKIIVARLTGG